MPTITFWSENEKTIGQTLSAALVATMMAIDHNYKTLLISLDWDNDTLENCFGAQESNSEIIKSLVQKKQMNLESGIKGLLKLADSNRITPELVHDYTKIVFKNRLEVLYPPNEVEEKDEEDIIKKIKNIIRNASRYYDYVFVDLKKGTRYKEHLEVLSFSDIVVLNVDQNLKSIERTLLSKEYANISHKAIWNICRYDKNSKYNCKNLVRNILKKQIVCQTNYNTQILDSAQEGSLAELLLRFRTLRSDEENLDTIVQAREVSEQVLLKYQQVRSGI